MPHLEEGTIHAWLDGALSDAEAAAVAKHAGECAECGAMVAEARGFIAGASRIVAALDIVPGGVIPATAGGGPRRAAQSSLWGRLRLTPARAAIAATLLVAVGSLFTVREQQDKAFMASAPTVGATAATPAVDSVSSAKKVVVGGVAGAREIAATRPEPATSAPAPSAAKPEAPSAKVAAQSTANANRLADAVVGAAPAARAPVPSAAPMPSPPVAAVTSEARRVDTAAAKMRARSDAGAGRGGRASALRLSEVVATSGAAASGMAAARDAAAVGTVCYAVTGALPSWAAVVPQRFVLDGMRASDTSVSRFLVRRVTPEGKTDGPIAGSWWQRLGRDSLPSQVTFPRAGSTTPVTLSLALDAASRALTATVRDSARVEQVQVSFAVCSP